MIPWTQHNIIAVETVFFFHVRVHQLRAIDIFLVIIATNMQLWNLWILNIIQRRIFLPECIIVGMLYKIVPGRDFIMKIFFIYIFQRTQFQIPVIQIKLGKGKSLSVVLSNSTS